MATENRGEPGTLAPVIPLFGDSVSDSGHAVPLERTADLDRDGGFGHDAPHAVPPESPDVFRDRAERRLLNKLRTRSLSIREARAAIAEPGLDAATIDDLVTDFRRRGYLDDAALAEQLVRAGVERKGQGRRALAQVLSKRGVPRDVADAAMTVLPDDDYERALTFARSKAMSLRNVAPDAALRRLTGQLSRRGYPGSVSLSAAREALREASAPA